jgi:GDPmannose 4,6-dehydratase
MVRGKVGLIYDIVIRRLSTPDITRIEHIADRITLIDGDLTDKSSLNIAMQTAQPDEV